jgi:hypothetical protein
MRRLIWFIVVATFAASSSYAQDISGDWQGSLKAGPQDLRIILKITRADSGEWKATMLSIDQSPDRGTGMVTTSFSMDASTIKFAIGQVKALTKANSAPTAHPLPEAGRKADRCLSISTALPKKRLGSIHHLTAYNSYRWRRASALKFSTGAAPGGH